MIHADRFEYVIGTHLFFRPTAASGVGSGGASVEGSSEALPAGVDARDMEPSGEAETEGNLGGLSQYGFYGKASKKLVFRPVVLKPK